jgi:hypothetical protein
MDPTGDGTEIVGMREGRPRPVCSAAVLRRRGAGGAQAGDSGG